MSATTRIDPLSVINSHCLDNSRSAYENEEWEMPDRWSLSYTDGILTLTWKNFEANCCPGEFVAWFEVENDNHLIYHLTTTEDECDCICHYDVTNTFGAIAPGHYTISFHHYYDIFTVEVDIEEGCDISLKAPSSGIKTLSASSRLMTLSEDGVLHTDVDGAYTVEIFDAAGSLRTHINADDTSDILVSTLQHGLYIVRLTLGQATETLRFVR